MAPQKERFFTQYKSFHKKK